MFSVGLVGLPNAGKSTLFNLLTDRSVPAANFPFTTVDPHDGVVELPDKRLAAIAKLANAQKIVPAQIEFRDIAGLVKNASAGEGLGNKFLAHIHEVDLILLVVRCFENNDIIHVENRVNPLEDEEILLLELTLHDQKRLENLIIKVEKEAAKDPDGKAKIQICEKIMTELSNLNPASSFVMDDSWDKNLIIWRNKLNLLTDKPILRLANISQDGENLPYKSDFDLDILLESEFSDSNLEERKELGMNQETGLDRMIQAAFYKLNLATYLTCGEKEAKAWTFNKGDKAPVCAGKIHTDFEKKFIKADVVSFEDFTNVGGWKNAFEKGCVKTMGKDYEMKDGDIVEFKIGN